MSSRKKSCEVPVQDFARIQLMFLPTALSNGKLFMDYTFPPDKSSLTYVYSGDDRYEKMVFKRPKDICSYSVFAGVGGGYETPFPWKSWKKNTWFEAAIAVVSLNVKRMDKLIPGYRNFDQSLQTDYIGCFCFKMWRFGEWVDIVVDDHLPTMDNNLLYCQAYGTPKEFWGPLVEKAYAKCKKTYEANECGRTLDALTDLTGGVCEFFTPDINPPQNLFHVLYKSCVNRSQMVCWRNDKLLTPTGFWFENDIADAGTSSIRYLHIITATTKFPLSDGRMVEMVRLLCPYRNEPLWNGKFADTDEISWGTVNMEFYAKYKPLGNKDENEYWMTLEDFRCNFGGLIICNTEIPYTTEGLSLQRCYRRLSEDEIKSGQKSLFAAPKERRRSSDSKHRRQPTASYLNIHRRSHPCLPVKTKNDQTEDNNSPQENPSDMGILVRENTRTVKVDNTHFNRASKLKKLRHKSKSESAKSMPAKKNNYAARVESAGAVYRKRDPSPVSCFKRLHLHDDGKSADADTADPKLATDPNDISKNRTSGASNIWNTSVNNRHSTGNATPYSEYCQKRSDSLISTCSALSECQSTFSASDITLNIGTSRDNSLQRPQSAPSNIVRNTSSGSLPNMIINNFVASSSDNFRSHGSWRFVIDYRGKWEKCDSMDSNPDMIKQHPRNPRIVLNIIHPDAVNEIVAPGYHGKSHVIISLLQDYRHGAPTANSLLVPIGFSVYKTKNPAKDEKRSLSKLSFVGEATLCEDSREVTRRFDLLPGSYFILPFCLSENHSGQYILRVLAERDPVAGKTGWGEISWGTVNMEFYAKYKPLGNKDENEYWMMLEDFRCNFGGLIICNTEIPYTTEGLSLQRCYRRLSEDEIKSGQKSLFAAPKERRRSSDSKHRRQPTASYLNIHRRSHPCLPVKTKNDQTEDNNSPQDNPSDMGILVRENTRTVKVDNTHFNRASKLKKLRHKSKSESAKSVPAKKNNYAARVESAGAVYRKRDPSPVSCFKRLHLHDDGKSADADTADPKLATDPNDISKNRTSGASNIWNTSVNNRHSTGNATPYSEYCQKRSDSLISTCSALSECQSTFSASDITLNIGTSRDNSLQRPQSAPSNIVRNTSSGSLPNMIINNFVASSSDNFRSHGSWRFVIDYRGKWEKCDSMDSNPDMIKQHPRNPRIVLNIIHPDAVNEIVAPGYHGKSHVIISLLQDYRHGAPTANSLLVPIGFSVYKTKNPAKDEKRSLSKLSFVGEATLCEDSREVTRRFDLLPGSYFILPFCLSENHSGQYILRVLAERDPVAGKTGCVIS